ncbi:hypothetical protein M3Y97_00600600 [Aphelenchoides bicaudatus]|nr:hypothetical protein M3Y97_00600600 [Aphelenchoides bicaudatus]
MGRKNDKSRDHRRKMKLADRNDDMPDCPDIDTTVTGEESTTPTFCNLSKLSELDDNSQWPGTPSNKPKWHQTYRGASPTTVSNRMPPEFCGRPGASNFTLNRERIVWIILCIVLAILFFSHQHEKNLQLECRFR